MPVHLTILNYDDMPHSVTPDDSSACGFGPFIANGGKDDGGKVDPATTTFDFTPQTKGNFRWHCAMSCDNDAGMWAMMGPVATYTANVNGATMSGMMSKEQGKDGYMAGDIVVD